MKRVMRARAMVVVITALVFSGCTGNRPPETTVLQVGSAVLDGATKLQKGITAATDAKTLSVPLAQKLTGYVEVIHAKSGPLGEALKAYHTATSLDIKKLKASEVQGLVADINAALGKFLGEAIPEGALHELTQLVGNVIAAVTAVQSTIAASLGR